MRIHVALAGLFGLLATPELSAGNEVPAWLTDGPRTDEAAIALDVPLQVFANQLHVDVVINGKPRRFLFDTGSPSMMDSALAAELGLAVVDRRQSRDSYGAIVESDIVQADLTLGGTTFRKVPVFVAPFPKVPKCLIDGVLGSEILPLCAWQIDVPGGALRCNTDANALAHVATAKKMPLHGFGYPHAPFLDIGLAKNASSKALFDTGSPEYLTISPEDLVGAQRNKGVGKTIAGTGSIGGSMGGRAPAKEQLLVQLKDMAIGPVSLGRVGALRRDSAPSLIGSSILQHFIVTLDSRHSTAYFDPVREGPYARPSFGFALDLGEAVTVSMIWKGSPADQAGLRVGNVLTSINGQPADPSCEGIRRAMQAMTDKDVMEIEWEGGAARLARNRRILD